MSISPSTANRMRQFPRLQRRFIYTFRALHIFEADGVAYCLDLNLSDVDVESVVEAAKQDLLGRSGMAIPEPAAPELWQRFANSKFVRQFGLRIGEGRSPVMVALHKEE